MKSPIDAYFASAWRGIFKEHCLTDPSIATNVECTNSWLNYSGSDLMRNALVSMKLTITDSSGESVTLQHEVHVNNTP